MQCVHRNMLEKWLISPYGAALWKNRTYQRTGQSAELLGARHAISVLQKLIQLVDFVTEVLVSHILIAIIPGPRRIVALHELGGSFPTDVLRLVVGENLREFLWATLNSNNRRCPSRIGCTNDQRISCLRLIVAVQDIQAFP